MSPKKNPQNRVALSIALVIAALGASFAMSMAANHKGQFWIVDKPVSAGAAIEQGDISLHAVALGDISSMYISRNENPEGLIAARNLAPGELLTRKSMSDDPASATHMQVALSVRSVDIPESVQLGEVVTIYQLHDAKNGEAAQPLEHIMSGVFITSINRKSANFGSEVAITVSVDRDYVADLLAATTSGRIVIVRSHG